MLVRLDNTTSTFCLLMFLKLFENIFCSTQARNVCQTRVCVVAYEVPFPPIFSSMLFYKMATLFYKMVHGIYLSIKIMYLLHFYKMVVLFLFYGETEFYKTVS